MIDPDSIGHGNQTSEYLFGIFKLFSTVEPKTIIQPNLNKVHSNASIQKDLIISNDYKSTFPD
jgi:hypothetical protein